jgi:hypothetical protein
MYYLNFLNKSPEKEKPKQSLIIHKRYLIMYIRMVKNGRELKVCIKLNAMEL